MARAKNPPHDFLLFNMHRTVVLKYPNYKKELFELLHSETFPLYLSAENGERDYTRDVLLVKGNLNGELVHILVIIGHLEEVVKILLKKKE